MKLLPIGIAAILLSSCTVIHAAPNSATLVSDEEVTLSDFDGVELRGGGELLILHGSDYRFEDTGTASGWKVWVKNDTLRMECNKPCRGGDLSATVTLPKLKNISLKGGGDITIRGDFTNTDELNVSIMGGGDIDAVAVPADQVNISLMGGGEIDVTAFDELNVSIMGGGQINYRGSPEISKSILGGGEVSPIK